MPAVPSDEEFLAYNQGVISEFRANQGVVSQPPFPILLLTTTGARTGRQATVPLGFAVDDNGRVFVMASKAGAPTHPAWFHNLTGQPVGDGGTRRQVLSGSGRRDGGGGARPALRHDFRRRLRIREEHRPRFPGHRPRRRPRARLTASRGQRRKRCHPASAGLPARPGGRTSA